MAKDKAFSLKNFMNSESQPKKKHIDYDIVFLPAEKLRPSKDNFYGMRGIRELADNIKDEGLHKNLDVLAANDQGEYEIIDGERRYRACMLALEDGAEQYSMLPCRILQFTDRRTALLWLINSNRHARILNDMELIEQARLLTELCTETKQQKKKEGYKVEGRVRDAVAEEMGVSSAQIGIYKQVDESLIPEGKEALKNQEISITAAHQIAKMDKDKQPEVLEEVKKGNKDALKEAKKKPEFTATELADIDHVLLLSGGNQKTIDFFSQDHTIKEKADFLKNELGTGGGSVTFSENRRGFMNYAPQGIKIEVCFGLYSDNSTISLTWSEAAKRIGELINKGEFMTVTEQEEKQEFISEGKARLQALEETNPNIAVYKDEHDDRNAVADELDRIIRAMDNPDEDSIDPEQVRHTLKRAVDMLRQV